MIESTVATYLRWAAGSRTTQTWTADYEARHRGIFEVYHNDWADPQLRDKGPALADQVVPVVEVAEARARTLIADVAGLLYADGLLPDAEPAAVLMVGYGTSNAWAANWRGRPALFVALEMFPPPPNDRLLIAHELVHVAHLARVDLERDVRVGTWLFAEGLATAPSRRYVPGLPDAAYIAFDDGGDAWLAACERAWPEICDRLAGALEGGEAAGERFFSRNPGVSGDLPSHCGYYAGWRLCEELLHHVAPTDLLGWDQAAILGHAEAFLTAGAVGWPPLPLRTRLARRSLTPEHPRTDHIG